MDIILKLFGGIGIGLIATIGLIGILKPDEITIQHVKYKKVVEPKQ